MSEISSEIGASEVETFNLQIHNYQVNIFKFFNPQEILKILKNEFTKLIQPN